MLDPDCHRPEFVRDIPKRQDQTEVTDNTREGIDNRTAIRVSRDPGPRRSGWEGLLRRAQHRTRRPSAPPAVICLT